MKMKKQPEQKAGGGINLDAGMAGKGRMGFSWTVDGIKALVTGSRYVQVLLLLTVIGGALRFINLGFNPLWLDEAVSLQFAQQTLGEYWQTVVSGTDFNPPLYIWILHFFTAFGSSEVVLRFLSALCGTLSIPAVYLMGKEFYDRNIGIIAAALLTFSMMHISYSQEARAYSLFVLFTIIQIWLYWRAIRENTPVSWVLFGLVSALSCWTHFYGFMMTGILVVFTPLLMVQEFRSGLAKARPFIYGLITCFIACLPLIVVTVGLFLIRTGKPVTFGLQGFNLFIMALVQFSAYSLPVMVLFIILFALGVLAILPGDWKKALFLAGVVVLTFIISNYLSYRMPMEARHLILLLPLFYTGVAASYLVFAKVVHNKALIYVFIVLAFLVSAPLLAGYYTTLSKEDWRGLSGELSRNTLDGDIVVTVPAYMDIPLKYYYSSSKDGTVLKGASSVETVQEIMRSKANASVYFVMTGDIMAVDPTGNVVATLEKSSVLLSQYPGSTGGIYLLKAN